MSLDSRLRGRKTPVSFTQKGGEKQRDSTREVYFQDSKIRIHSKLLDRIDLHALAAIPPEEAKQEVTVIVRKIISEEKMPMSTKLQEELVKQVVNETFGLGPLEPLLAIPTIDEILVNGHKQVYVEQNGKLSLSNVTFKDDEHLRHIINRIVAKVGRRIDEASPMVDARLADGSRINAIIPPLAIDGPTLSIRRFKAIPLELNDLIRFGALTESIGEFLKKAVSRKLNILISGGTGTGKTTILNVLSRFIASDERIITIEDAAELQLQQNHVVRLETRPPNIEGKGEVTIRDLLINSLRMRPDRIVVGEVRGTEALDMLQAMNTGHEGSLTTIHANSQRDAISRIETMVMMANSNLNMMAITKQIAAALHLIIQIRRYKDGTRKIAGLSEVIGMEKDVVTLQELMEFEETGVDQRGRVVGKYKVNPVTSKYIKDVKLA